MRTQVFAGLLTLTSLTACRPSNNSDTTPGLRTYSSFDASSGTNAPVAPHAIRLVEADLEHTLSLYQELSGRSVIRSARVPMATKITFDNQTPLTRVETLQALDNVLAANGIVMVCLGTKFVKAVTQAEAVSESGPVIESPPEQLPDSSSFLVYVVRLKHLRAADAVPLLVPYAKLPNSIVAATGSDVLTLRDYSSNVRRMLQVLEENDRPESLRKTAERILNPSGAPPRGGLPRRQP